MGGGATLETVEREAEIALLRSKIESLEGGMHQSSAFEEKSKPRFDRDEILAVLKENRVDEVLRTENLALKSEASKLKEEMQGWEDKRRSESEEMQAQIKFLKNELFGAEERNKTLVQERDRDRVDYMRWLDRQRLEHVRIEKEINGELRTILQKRELNEEAVRECTILRRRNEELRTELAALNDAYAARCATAIKIGAITDKTVFTEIESLAGAYEKLDDEHRKLRAEHQKAEERIGLLEKTKESLTHKISEMERLQVKLAEKSVANGLDQKLVDLEAFKTELENQKTVSSQYKKNLLECHNENEKYKKQLLHLSEELKSKTKNSDFSAQKFNELHVEVETLKSENSKLMKLVDVCFEGKSSEVLVDVEKYKALLRCTVCNSKYKDTAILRCMHVFCGGCVDELVRVRNRKCPTCGEGFTLNDVKKIFL